MAYLLILSLLYLAIVVFYQLVNGFIFYEGSFRIKSFEGLQIDFF